MSGKGIKKVKREDKGTDSVPHSPAEREDQWGPSIKSENEFVERYGARGASYRQVVAAKKIREEDGPYGDEDD